MYDLKPYPVCIGHNKYRKLPQLYRSITLLFATKICNQHLLDKNKIRFFKQFYRWFLKYTRGFNVEPILKNGRSCKIAECDIIHVSCKVTKASFKKFLTKINLQIADYKLLKRRKYTLTFTFFFCDINILNKNIYLDISSMNVDWYKIFIVTNGYYINDLLQLLFYFYVTLEKLTNL